MSTVAYKCDLDISIINDSDRPRKSGSLYKFLITSICQQRLNNNVQCLKEYNFCFVKIIELLMLM